MVILFQGDSVTDCGRKRESGFHSLGLGHGFVSLIASELMCNHPNIKIYNRGVNGNRIVDMYSRWEEDVINIPFDILSILNGINDIGFGIRLNCGADKEKFKFIYDRLLYETLDRKPECKIVLCEPFLVKMDSEGSNDIFENWSTWESTLNERSEVVRELSVEYGTVFVPLRKVFADALKIAPPEHWSADAIHPTHAGHELIARAWLGATEHLINKRQK